MTHCYHCGADSRPVRVEGLDVPTCEVHGPLWLLVRVGAAADVLVEREGKLLLVRRATDPFVDHWASVGGFVDPGESPADAARREAREELGIDVELRGLLGVYHQEYVPGQWLVVAAYVATTETEPVPGSSEIGDWGWFLPDHLPSPTAWNHRVRIEDWAKHAAGRLKLGQAR